MTREESIETLKLLKPNMRFDKSGWVYTKQALEMAIKALSQVTEVRKLILQAERSGVHLDYGAYKFMNALEKIVGEKQIGEFEQESCDDAISREDAMQALNDTLAEYIPYFRKDQIGIPLKCARALNDLPSVTPTEKVIEDIKAEIEEAKEKTFCTDDEKQGLDVAVTIIDKHIKKKW